MSEALIFDCDGTLADTMPAHYRAWLEVLRPHEIAFSEGRFYSLGGTPTMDIARLLVGDRSLDPQALGREKESVFLTKLGEVLPIEKVVSVARRARGLVPMAVASGGYRRVVELTLEQIGLRDWFAAVVTAEDTPRHKPDPDVFLEAARRLGADPRGCTVYEDTDIGIEGARRAGMRWVDVRTL